MLSAAAPFACTWGWMGGTWGSYGWWGLLIGVDKVSDCEYICE